MRPDLMINITYRQFHSWSIAPLGFNHKLHWTGACPIHAAQKEARPRRPRVVEVGTAKIRNGEGGNENQDAINPTSVTTTESISQPPAPKKRWCDCPAAWGHRNELAD